MKVGSLVECIKTPKPTDGNYLLPGEELPIKGKIYAVRDIEKCGNELGIRLEEVINPVYEFKRGAAERLFNAKNFAEILPPIEDIVEYINSNTFQGPVYAF